LARKAVSLKADTIASTVLAASLRDQGRAHEAQAVLLKVPDGTRGLRRCYPLAAIAAACIDLEDWDGGERWWMEYASVRCPPRRDTKSLEKLRNIRLANGDTRNISEPWLRAA
jgi:hypothetical protein